MKSSIVHHKVRSALNILFTLYLYKERTGETSLLKQLFRLTRRNFFEKTQISTISLRNQFNLTVTTHFKLKNASMSLKCAQNPYILLNWAECQWRACRTLKFWFYNSWDNLLTCYGHTIQLQ